MKNALKTKCLTFVLLLTLVCSSLLLGGCSEQTNDDEQTNDEQTNYVGTYQSTFVDSQNDDESISFTLVINSDKTFALTRYKGDVTKEFSGYYKSYTESGKEQLLFIVEEGYEFNTVHPNAWNPYFSICRLDDGTLMATAGTTSASAAVTAFGSGSVTKITLILFTKA